MSMIKPASKRYYAKAGLKNMLQSILDTYTIQNEKKSLNEARSTW
jgi:hypothetical protein